MLGFISIPYYTSDARSRACRGEGIGMDGIDTLMIFRFVLYPVQLRIVNKKKVAE